MSNFVLRRNTPPSLLSVSVGFNIAQWDDQDEVKLVNTQQVATLKLIKPTIPEVLRLMSHREKMIEAVKGVDSDPQQSLVYASNALMLLDFIYEVEGVCDEEGNPVPWAEFSDDEKETFLLTMSVEVIGTVFAKLVAADHLGVDKKKSSSTSSVKSTKKPAAGARRAGPKTK